MEFITNAAGTYNIGVRIGDYEISRDFIGAGHHVKFHGYIVARGFETLDAAIDWAQGR